MDKREETIKAEMRLSVLEYLVAKLYVVQMVGMRMSAEEAREAAKAHAAEEQKFPKLDPAMSDLASAEWREALERMLDMQTQMLAQAWEKAGLRP